MKRFAPLIALLVVTLTRTAAAANGLPPQMWLAGEDPVVQKDKHKDQPADYMDMFKSGAPWGTAASGMTAFKVSTQFVLRGTDEELRAVINDLKERHIAFAIEAGLIDGGANECGKAVEGYSNHGSTEVGAKRIKNLGGQIDYIAMDEPVWFGHIAGQLSGGRRGCQYSLEDLTKQIAGRIAILHRYFPNAQVGDIEPINAKVGGVQSINDIVAFESMLHQKTGVAPAFVHADMGWQIPGWQPLLRNLFAKLRAQGIPVGVICDGDANAGGDVAGVRQALQRCRDVASNPQTRPDVFIVQSWEPLPTKMLPENDPGSLTYEARQVMTWVR